ncbi:MAG TPA: FAD-dependent oxidoreductase [Candidatus Latescibacteria bacterium]|nr:FAD-dependent oxidoreductase [Candidatus Handelsmanbacteria bacterium]HIL07888.1 FAD-dependent oxidoreductase [Candidatus Latescibacterota bacterium]
MRIGIIGAGIFGLASALALRERSHEVCLFEQDTIPCARAFSTDLSKIIRRTNCNGTHLELFGKAAEQ